MYPITGPISLIPICCKILEHVLYSALMNHLTSIEFFNPKQHGFRQGFSCTTQLIEFYHDIASALDDRGQIDCLFLDFRKAFDTVSHSVLIQKLQNLNIDQTICGWIKDYLTARKQKVVLGGSCSRLVSVTSGVPQGSVLGPLLFLVYINDISDVVKCRIRMFADDCVLYTDLTDQTDSTQLQEDLNHVEVWCKNNDMVLNTNKCVHVSFTKRVNRLMNQYILNNHVIRKEDKYKYLGVTFSEDGGWSEHIGTVVSRAGKALGFLQRNLKHVTTEVKQAAYHAYVRPILEYACPVWDPFQKVHIHALERIQSLAARFVLGKYDRTESSRDMKRDLNWQSLQNRRRNLRLKIFYSIYNKKTGINPSDYLKPAHYQSSRHDHKFKVRSYSPRTDLFKHSFFPQAIAEWNMLPAELVDRKTADSFYEGLCPPQ